MLPKRENRRDIEGAGSTLVIRTQFHHPVDILTLHLCSSAIDTESEERVYSRRHNSKRTSTRGLLSLLTCFMIAGIETENDFGETATVQETKRETATRHLLSAAISQRTTIKPEGHPFPPRN